VFAIIKSGGRQLKVTPGAIVEVDRVQLAAGDKVTIDEVLFLGKDDGTIRGKAALRDYMGMALKKIPDLRFTLDRVFSGVNSVVLEFHTTDGRHGAEFMEFGRNGLVARVSATYAAG